MMNLHEVEDILGYAVCTEAADHLLDEIVLRIRHQDAMPYYLACFNPHSCVVAAGDPEFKHALLNATCLVPDGAGVVLASRLLGGRIKDRITGSDVFTGILDRLNAAGHGRIFLLGGTEPVLEKITARLAREYPHVTVAGSWSPPYQPSFAPADTAGMIQRIRASDADVLWVGLGAPKQEKWIAENLSQLPVPFVAAIGAVFDFYSGEVKRTSPALQRLGLEWLPRLLREPRRLWRRNFISTPRFLAAVLKQWLKQRPGNL